MNGAPCIEEIILRYPERGMDLLAPHLPPDFCHQAAQAVLALPRGVVLLTTGFYVRGFAETDGPSGTWAVAKALERLGFHPVIVVDELCRGYFEPEGLETVYVPYDTEDAFLQGLLEQYQPVLLFALERCGINRVGEYMNMHGVSIRHHTAPIDRLFTLSHGRIPSIGVGDGGNEIGMGSLADIIAEKLPLCPCTVEVDHPLIATVSNWGGYGLCAALQQLTVLPLLPTFAQVRDFIARTVALGSVDGVIGVPQVTEDGYPLQITEEILDALKMAAKLQ